RRNRQLESPRHCDRHRARAAIGGSMKLLDSLRFRIATLFHRSQMNAEIEDELRSHIQHRADDLERSGLPRAEAERRARIEFGGIEQTKEACREAAGGTSVESILRNGRFER